MEKDFVISRIDEDILAISKVDLITESADVMEEKRMKISNLQAIKYMLEVQFIGRYKSDEELFNLITAELEFLRKKAAKDLKSGVDKGAKLQGMLISNFNKSLEIIKLWENYSTTVIA